MLIVIKELILLYRQERSTRKYASCKIRTKLHSGLEWSIIHTPSIEDIDDVSISRFVTVVFRNGQFVSMISNRSKSKLFNG